MPGVQIRKRLVDCAAEFATSYWRAAVTEIPRIKLSLILRLKELADFEVWPQNREIYDPLICRIAYLLNGTDFEQEGNEIKFWSSHALLKTWSVISTRTRRMCDRELNRASGQKGSAARFRNAHASLTDLRPRLKLIAHFSRVPWPNAISNHIFSVS